MPVVAAGTVFAPIVHAYFFRDDFYHLFNLSTRGLLPFLFLPFAGHLLVLRNLVFGAMHWAFGVNPMPYFAVVLATHVANVALLTRLLDRATSSLPVAAAVALAWGISPTSEETLAWYSVYGQVLATTCVLAALILLLDGTPLPAGILVFAASLFFGSGVAVAMIFPLLARLVRPPSGQPALGLRGAALVPISVGLAYLAVYVWVGVVGADTTFERTLVTHLPDTIFWIVPVTAILGGIGIASLTFGWLMPLEHLQAIAIVGAVSGWTVLAVVGFRSRRGTPGSLQERWRMLAVGLAIAASCYASVGLTRGGMPLPMLAATQRYHYTALVGVALAAATIICAVYDRYPLRRRIGEYALLLFWLGAMLAWFRSAHVIDPHDGARREVQTVFDAVDRAVDEAAPGSPVCLENRDFYYDYLPESMMPGWAGVFVSYFPSGELHGHRVFFTEARRAVRGVLKGTLIPPGACPGVSTVR